MVDAELTTVDALAQLSFVVQAALERRAAEQDLSMIQTRLLGVLRDRTPTMNELAALLELDKSSVTGLVDRAERRGLVERVPSTADRRAVNVRLTSTARKLITRAASGFEADVAEILGSLPAADQRMLATLISRVLIAHATDHGVNLFPRQRGQRPTARP